MNKIIISDEWLKDHTDIPMESAGAEIGVSRRTLERAYSKGKVKRSKRKPHFREFVPGTPEPLEVKRSTCVLCEHLDGCRIIAATHSRLPCEGIVSGTDYVLYMQRGGM